jgi:2,5-furandicarboxylate decarboxylase 1
MNLRNLLDQLESENRLIRINKEVSAEYEIANVINTLGEQPVIFENVKGYEFPVFGGITSSRDVIATGLGTTKEKVLFKLVDALRKPQAPEIVDSAPCQEVVVTEPDLDKLPILMHLPGDGGKYVTASVCTIKDPDSGRNVSYHRLMQLGKNRFSARLIPKRQTRTTYDKLEGDLEMAVCLGNSVPVMIAASLGPPTDVDEFSIANSMDEMKMVKCRTKDLEVPAESEIVLEGRITKDVDREGPFVDLIPGPYPRENGAQDPHGHAKGAHNLR